jgi:hypothetical protein
VVNVAISFGNSFVAFNFVDTFEEGRFLEKVLARVVDVLNRVVVVVLFVVVLVDTVVAVVVVVIVVVMVISSAVISGIIVVVN